jgi:8-oxo-dGTP pyrophosphatase MutT (NUDIX family)
MLKAIVTRVLRWHGLLKRTVTLGVRGVVRHPDGRVLLVRHTYMPGWYLPGGGVDPGETALEAFAREVWEETGVVLARPPRVVTMFVNPRLGRRDHVVFLEGFAPMDAVLAGPSREIAELGWFSLEALPEGVTPATRRRLDELFDGRAAERTW